jgi:transketolase
MGAEAIKTTKEFYNWPLDPPFYVPEEALAHMRNALDRGKEMERQWNELFEQYRAKHPEEAKTFELNMRGELPQDWDAEVPVFQPTDGSIATRAASGKVMNGLAKRVTNLVGGSADLGPSTKTDITAYGPHGLKRGCAQSVHFGVREHGMGAAVNGMALHGGLIPYGATFFVFSDYLRPSMRLSALMNAHAIFVFTHDSIGVGEDGPTHQPIEHLASVRAIPNLTVIRPGDANETAAAWKAAVQSKGPVALIFSRQKLPILDPVRYPISDGVPKGAYVLSDCDGKPDIILIATGSEVSITLAAQEKLADEGIKARVVSMPSWELFAEQPKEYKNQVLPPAVKCRLAVEAGATFGWERWVGGEGAVIGIDHFGASAPGSVVLEKSGFTPAHIVGEAKRLLNK